MGKQPEEAKEELFKIELPFIPKLGIKATRVHLKPTDAKVEVGLRGLGTLNLDFEVKHLEELPEQKPLGVLGWIPWVLFVIALALGILLAVLGHTYVMETKGLIITITSAALVAALIACGVCILLQPKVKGNEVRT